MANIGTSLKNWSSTAASNQPDGTDASTIAGDLQAVQAGVRYLYSQDTIASATTCDLGSKDAGSLTISGTTTITGLGTVSAGIRKNVLFSGILILTHHVTALILPSAANITTAANDTAEFESLGAGNWRCLSYTRASGTALVSTGDVLKANLQLQTYTAFTTGGTSSAFTLTPTPAITANTANTRFRVKFNAAPTGSPTLAISGQAAANLKYYDSTGTKQFITSALVPINWISDVEFDGTDWVVSEILPPVVTSKIQPIEASVAANALTLTINPTALDFRDTTLTSGAVSTVNIASAISMVVSSGSLLGTVGSTSTATFATSVMTVTSFDGGSPLLVGQIISATGVTAGTYITSFGTGTGGTGTYNLSTSPGTLASRTVTVAGQIARLSVLAINNAGTAELAVTRGLGLTLDETGVITTVAEGGAGAADSGSVIYSTTARVGVAYRVVGFVDSTQTVAGVYATQPAVQGIGYGAINSALTPFRFTSADQAITSSGRLILPHGLGAVPFHVSYLLKCLTAEAGYAIGDLVVCNHSSASNSGADTFGMDAVIDATNITIRFNTNATVFQLRNKTTGSNTVITNANWNLIVKAEV